MRIGWNRRLVVRSRARMVSPRPTLVGLGALAVLVALSVVPGASSGKFAAPTVASTGLQGVDCISRSDCWAVGDAPNKAGTHVNLALHWNGRKWKRVSTPNPGGTSGNSSHELVGVSCLSASDCWAVGGSSAGLGGPGINQALHWNGRKWKLVSTPDPGGTSGSSSQQLLGVSCLSASDCWAVGGTGAGPGSVGLDQALHWGGSKWKSVDVVDPGGKTGMAINVLRGVACVKASDCWAVGTYLDGTSGERLNQTQHWNGKKWKLVTTTSPGQSSGMVSISRTLPAVACPSATACRAVGSYPNKAGATLNEALRFNGRKWSVMPTPDPGGTSGMDKNGLDGVACTAASDCWAVGTFAGGSGGMRNEALRWDGKQWLKVLTPNPGGKGATAQRLAAVACASAKDCWAVGSYIPAMATGASNQMLHWNGRKWKKE